MGRPAGAEAPALPRSAPRDRTSSSSPEAVRNAPNGNSRPGCGSACEPRARTACRCPRRARRTALPPGIFLCGGSGQGEVVRSSISKPQLVVVGEKDNVRLLCFGFERFKNGLTALASPAETKMPLLFSPPRRRGAE